ncbi:MAG: chemotaxis protein CheZ, partial [Massilia sp.]|nr:chemotaxis protein CheZ [Massilia sp.]
MTDAADDFDALFDEVSAQRATSPPVAQAAPAAAAGEDDLEALFDRVAIVQVASAQ